ncbi:hypothetical protein GOBAR_DD29449 [Gossypium barbadense]|nr:hypothetical protein GOBAR_DD29449 [Gossypium barbadense]
MLRKNWLLKIRHPFITAAEILLPTIVILLLIGIRTRVDTQIHPAQPYIRKDMFVEIGKGISPNFQQVLELLLAKREYIAFAPDTEQTRQMVNLISIKFPLLQPGYSLAIACELQSLHFITYSYVKIYNDELELDTYIQSDLYGTCDFRNCSNPKIKGAVVFHNQGPQLFDYSIRLNHTWAFSGFPDVKSIMDTNGPYLNDLELGVNIIPTMQYSFSGFLTLQQVLDSFIIFAAQQTESGIASQDIEIRALRSTGVTSSLGLPWTQFSPSNIRIAPFPTREYTDDEFQSIIKSVLGLLYLLGFLYPISRLISYTVFEKEQKIREGLYMMGLKDGIFHLSWLITYAFQFAISSVIITVCTMDNLFKYSDKTVVFVYFFVFGLSAIMLSFLISTFFTRTKTAVAVGTLSFLGAFFPYYTVNDEAVAMVLKVIASFLSPTAFALGSINFADYERAHVGLRWSNIWRGSSGVNFLVCLLMMLFDTLLYCVVGLYLDKVLPSENGVRYPWNFMFQKCFWKKRSAIKHHVSSYEVRVNDTISKRKNIFPRKDMCGPAVEAISLEMKQQEIDGRCIQIKDLHKVYATKKGKCCAVNSLQLTLYENQILALLGHNGAGKSTTISMLVGLLPPTSGDALVLGKSILTDMLLCGLYCKLPFCLWLFFLVAQWLKEIRKGLGVCPQHDILFPELTVREHLEMFAILKGVKEDGLESAVTEMVDEVGLADKLNTVVLALSGGMKRKLSLGIALIGNSKVIILDEPTSGMDPYSMRLTWQLIKKIKKGRIILLTTHSMDEADELGDRIAIMADGSLKCCGSSLFLKHQYGVGYTLTLVKGAPTASIAADIVYRYVPSATCVSEVGTEISFKLPLAASSVFESMFREIESCIGRSVSNSETSISEDKNYFGIESYGISVTTLEEVFLRVAGCDFDEAESVQEGNNFVSIDSIPSGEQVPKRLSYAKLSGSYKKIIEGISSIVTRFCGLFVSIFLSFMHFLSMQCCSCCMISRSIFWQHSKALLIKRAVSARRDRKTIVFQLLIPVIFLLFGLLFLKLKPHPEQQSVTFTTSLFNPLLSGSGGGGPIPFDLSWPIAKEVAKNVEGGWIQKFKPTSYKFPDSERALADAVEAAGPTLGPVLLSMSEFLMSSFNESYQSSFFPLFEYSNMMEGNWDWNRLLKAFVMDEQYDDGSLGYTVLHNSSCQHAAPTFINLMNSAILRLATSDKNMTIRARNHPLPMTKSQRLQHHDLDAFSAAIIVNIAFSFIPASFAVPLVKEQEVKAKHQQLISGVSVISYWVSTYIWDFISFLFPSTFAIVLFYVFGLDQFIGRGFLPTVIMFLEYGLAIASSTYCLTFFFSDHSMAQNVVLLIHFFTGLILMVISFIMGLIKTTASANSFLKAGECFGFLGTNGAGKTTTLSMLTGEESPTEGTAFIFGKDISSNPKAARRHIGYCPQFDALLEYLTVQEHLELYARIKGVLDYRMNDVVLEKLVEFDLLKHADKPSYTLSGGNKRKLSVAIAMIGDPPIVILDEPSTGMDPIAKRFMWEVISRLSTRQGKTAVILTTHSMNEAQALCTRIGIMVGGRLRCIGSPQHLKTRFGNHLELEIKPTEVSASDLENLCRIIQEMLFDIPSHPRSLLNDLEVCIGAIGSITSGNASVAEISLSKEMIIVVGRWLGNEERVKTLISSRSNSDGLFGEQLSEQLVREGGIPLPIFSEWWLAREKFSAIDSFILSSFPGATFHGCNGLSVKYQLPYREGLSLADVFGHLERNR